MDRWNVKGSISYFDTHLRRGVKKNLEKGVEWKRNISKGLIFLNVRISNYSKIHHHQSINEHSLLILIKNNNETKEKASNYRTLKKNQRKN